jgi:gluconolactonase
MNAFLTVYDPSVFEFINKDFEIETLAGDCLFTEGPVWNSREGYYLFSDTTANAIYKIVPGKTKEVFLFNAGADNPGDADHKPGQAGPNGLAYEGGGDLLICQHGNHAIAKFDGKALRPLVSHYKGRPFNSPNDLILHSDGRIYFSDPPYGLKDGRLNPSKFQPLAGVYCWKDGALQLFCDRYQYPNGVCLSPGEELLYICSNKPFEKFISVYETVTNRFIKVFTEENSDGIECDRAGNVYLSNKDGIIILDKQGRRLALIALPSVPANHCWGGNELNDLLITARENIFLIRGLQR